MTRPIGLFFRAVIITIAALFLFVTMLGKWYHDTRPPPTSPSTPTSTIKKADVHASQDPKGRKVRTIVPNPYR